MCQRVSQSVSKWSRKKCTHTHTQTFSYYTVSDRKNATFSVAVFEWFNNLKANIQYTILIRKDWSFIIWNPINAISIHKLFIINQKRLLKKAIRKKCKFAKNTSQNVKETCYHNAIKWILFQILLCNVAVYGWALTCWRVKILPLALSYLM